MEESVLKVMDESVVNEEEEKEILDERALRIQKTLSDIFGPYEKFSTLCHDDKVKRGLMWARVRTRSSHYISKSHRILDSPSHVPVQVALHSMRHLVEEPLSALTAEFPGTSFKSRNDENGISEKNGNKRRKTSRDEDVEPKKKKESNINFPKNSTRREKSTTFSPDSGILSNENEITDDSTTVEAMLNIMTSLEEPRLSPISEHVLDRVKVLKKEENNENNRITNNGREGNDVSKFSTLLDDDSSISAASTSREVTPVKTTPLPACPSTSSESSLCAGQLKLKHVKPERIKKLLDIAKRSGKLAEDGNGETHRQKAQSSDSQRSNREETPPCPTERRSEEKKVRTDLIHLQKPPNKTVQSLVKENSLPPKRQLSPSVTRSPISVGHTPTGFSRPSSSLSTYDPSASHATPKNSGNTTEVNVTVKTSTTVPTRFACQWEHAKLRAAQRVPIPDLTDPKIKSKSDFYHGLAKDYKGQADKNKDRVYRTLNYMLSSIFFCLEAITRSEKEKTPQARLHCSSVIRDSYSLLGLAVFQGVRECEDTLACHILPRLKIVGQIMLSVIQYQLYILRSDSVLKNYARLDLRETQEFVEIRTTGPSTESNLTVPQVPNKLMATVSQATGGANLPTPSAASTPSSTITTAVTPWIQSLQSSTSSVTVPQFMYDVMKSQLKTANSLILSSRYWEDSKRLGRMIDVSFIQYIESLCTRPIGMDMSFDHLAQFVLTAVGCLKAEYEEEMKLPVKPLLAKVKPPLDLAMKFGQFHSQNTDRPKASQSTTPQPRPQSVRTPTPNAMPPSK